MAIRKPPKYKKTYLCPYAAVVSEIETALVIGNKTMGIKAVAAMGIASSIHQIAIQAVVARTFLPSKLRSLKGIN